MPFSKALRGPVTFLSTEQTAFGFMLFPNESLKASIGKWVYLVGCSGEGTSPVPPGYFLKDPESCRLNGDENGLLSAAEEMGQDITKTANVSLKKNVSERKEQSCGYHIYFV